MTLQIVPKPKTLTFCDGEFHKLLELAGPFMSEFQKTMVKKSSGEYISRSDAEKAHNDVCDHIHEGLLNSLSKIAKGQFKGDRHRELWFMLGLLGRLNELEEK